MTELKLKPEVKTAWVEALRSGEYRQGRGSLRIPGGRGKYCCLGVLADLAIKSGDIEGLEWSTTSPDGLTDPDGLFWSGTLSPSVAKWAFGTGTDKVIARDPRVKVSGEPHISLSRLNDGLAVGPHNFMQIADLIEEQL
jgi:hypothetical protein